MRTRLDVYFTRSYVEGTYLDTLVVDAIPTTSIPAAFDMHRKFYLTNHVNIDFAVDTYNGKYYVAQSLMFLDNSTYPLIELVLENSSNIHLPNLYLKGQIAGIEEKDRIILQIEGALSTKLTSCVTPRTSLDYISFNGFVHDCPSIIFNKDGTIKITTNEKWDMETFRNTISL